MKMIIGFVFIVLLISEDVWSQDCHLNATNMDRRWIFAIKNASNKFIALRTDILKDQEKLHLICKSVNTLELQCNRGAMQTIPPEATCTRRLKASMTPLENVEPCRLKDGQMYDIRYNLPIGRTSISLYQVCYNKAREEAVYSHHLVYGSTIAASTYQRPQFVTGNVVDQARANSFEAANVYNAFVGLLGPNQEYVKSTSQSDRIIDRGHLANSQDFLTYDQMDETFKYINVIPQFASINRSNWKRLENWVHNLPQGMQYAEVITGTYGVLELEHSQSKKMTPMFLMANGKNPIPKWIYKVVKYNRSCYAFVTFNNPFSNTAGSNSPCLAVTCPEGLEFALKPGSGVSNCCNYPYLVVKVGQEAALC